MIRSIFILIILCGCAKPPATRPASQPASAAYQQFLAPLRDEVGHDQSARFASDDKQLLVRVATTLFRDDSGVFEDVTTIRIHDRAADKNRDVRLPGVGNHVQLVAFLNSVAWIHYTKESANGELIHHFIDESKTTTLELKLPAARSVRFDPEKRQIIHFDPQRQSDRVVMDFPPSK